MMIGIEALYESSYEKLIYTLLKGIDFKKYDFYVVEDELFLEDGNKKLPDNFGIDDYNEFLKSDCQFILLVTDNRYIECYFKDENIKKIFIDNLKADNISYEIKTVENDGRNAMNLF